MEHTMKGEHSSDPKVTVVIPCYNDGAYIDDAIRSILNQTYQDYRIIVVDDGSDDTATIEKLKSLNYPKTTVLHKKNGGVSSARNYGVKYSNSEYLLFLDADDFFENSYLEKAVNVLDNNSKIGVVSCYERYFCEHDIEKTINIYKPKGGGGENFLVENNALSNSLVRYECWCDAGGYIETLLSHEDWGFWISITKKGWLVYTIPEILANYRVTRKSKYNKYKHKKPELIKKIIEHNKDIYMEYVAECLYEKEKEILHLKEKAKNDQNKIKKSYPYLIGLYITFPFRVIRKIVGVTKKIP